MYKTQPDFKTKIGETSASYTKAHTVK